MSDKISLNQLLKLFPDTTNTIDLYNHPDINRYSIWKPTNYYTNIKRLTLEQIKEAHCSLKPKILNVWGDPDSFKTLDTDWDYIRPDGGEGSPYRLGDFRYYNPNALPPLISSGNITVHRKTLENLTSSSRVNFKMNCRFSEMTWGLIGHEDENMMPLNYIIPASLSSCRLGVGVYIPESSKWEFFYSDVLDEYPEEKDVLHKADGTLQDMQYLNRLPKFSSNTNAVKAMLNSESKEFYYMPCLLSSNLASKYPFPGAKPSILKIEDLEINQSIANDCPDKYIAQTPDKWVVALIYERDENGLITLEYNGIEYFRCDGFYILNKTNPIYLDHLYMSFGMNYKYLASTDITNASTGISIDTRTGYDEFEFNGKKYYGYKIETHGRLIDIPTVSVKYTVDQDFYN